MSVVMYGVGVSVPEIPWENERQHEQRRQREALEREMREALQRAAVNPGLGQLFPPRGATIAELEALTKRVEALEQAIVRAAALPKRKRTKASR